MYPSDNKNVRKKIVLMVYLVISTYAVKQACIIHINKKKKKNWNLYGKF